MLKAKSHTLGIWKTPIYRLGPSCSKWLAGEKLKYKLTSSWPLKPSIVYRAKPSKNSRSASSPSSRVSMPQLVCGWVWIRKCLPRDQGFNIRRPALRSWFFRRDIYLHLSEMTLSTLDSVLPHSASSLLNIWEANILPMIFSFLLYLLWRTENRIICISFINL